MGLMGGMGYLSEEKKKWRKKEKWRYYNKYGCNGVATYQTKNGVIIEWQKERVPDGDTLCWL